MIRGSTRLAAAACAPSLALVLGLAACTSEPAATPPARHLIAREDWPGALHANRVAHPRFQPASRPIAWMAFTAYDLAGNRGTPERLFLPGMPFTGPTLEIQHPGGGPFWVSGQAAGGRAPIRISLWMGLPEGEMLGGERVIEVHGWDPAREEDRVDTLEATGPTRTLDGFTWVQVEALLDGDRLGQLELRARTDTAALRLGQPIVLGGPSMLALTGALPPLARSRRATPSDEARAARSRQVQRSAPWARAPLERNPTLLERRRRLRAMGRAHPP